MGHREETSRQDGQGHAQEAPIDLISSIGERVETVEVQIGPQFLNLFSEHLYSSPNKAFEELISNSWDAGATEVHVHVPDDLQSPRASIWILDNGGSMDVEGFRALWAVASSTKRESSDPGARKPIGKFGVGKLATYLLADELTYVCRAADGVIRAITMDYRLIDKGEKNALHIDPVPLAVRVLTVEKLQELLRSIKESDEAAKLISSGLKNAKPDPHYVDEFGGPDITPLSHLAHGRSLFFHL
jgi:hypothetical protein